MTLSGQLVKKLSTSLSDKITCKNRKSNRLKRKKKLKTENTTLRENTLTQLKIIETIM